MPEVQDKIVRPTEAQVLDVVAQYPGGVNAGVLCQALEALGFERRACQNSMQVALDRRSVTLGGGLRFFLPETSPGQVVDPEAQARFLRLSETCVSGDPNSIAPQCKHQRSSSCACWLAARLNAQAGSEAARQYDEPPEGEFRGDVWHVFAEDGSSRPATPAECGLELQRLRALADDRMEDAAEIYMRSFGPSDGGFDLELQGRVVRLVAAHLAETFKRMGGENYVSIEVNHEELGPLVLTMQRRFGQRPEQVAGIFRDALDAILAGNGDPVAIAQAAVDRAQATAARGLDLP